MSSDRSTPHDAVEVISDTLYAKLRNEIVQGTISAGSRLIELELCERLGASRTPLRAALRHLEQDGLVERVGHGRRTMYRVPLLTAEDAREVYSLMGLLEGSVARRIGTAGRDTRRSIAAAARLAQDAFEAALGTPRSARSARTIPLPELHDAFHEAYVSVLATQRLRRLIDATRPCADRYEWLYARELAHTTADVTIREHRSIIAALAAGDGERAATVVHANWVGSGERLASLITASS